MLAGFFGNKKNETSQQRLPIGKMVIGGIILLAVISYVLTPSSVIAVTTNTPTVFKKGSRSPVVTASGYIVARTRATLSSKALGRVSYLGVQEGSRVQKGQVLAKLESPDLEASRDSLLAQVNQAKIDFNRSSKLLSEGIESQANNDQLSSRLKTLQSQLNYQTALLESMVLKAPFAGVVTQKLSEVGETVAPGSAGGANAINALVVMADFNTLEVEVEVSETSVAKLVRNMAAEIRVDALERKKDSSVLRGRLREIYPSSNRQKATILVRVLLDQRDEILVPDMGAKVTFLGEPYDQDVVVIGREQVYRDPASGESFTWVAEKEKAVKKNILILNSSNPIGVEVSGLEANAQLIIAPPENLQDGQKLAVKKM